MTNLFPIDQIKANPYQTRLSDDAEHIAGIAESIKVDGLLQVPLARRVNGHVELAFGHTRLAAWQLAKPGEPFPLDLRELTDRQMSDFAAAENGRRKNLSAIETATAIDRRIKDFKLTQLEAAAPFGYSSQGSVSNLLRLLKLPPKVQAMVQDGQLPERRARMLVNIARVNAATAAQIADKMVEAGDDEEAADQAMDAWVRKHGELLDEDGDWELDWPAQPISVNLKDDIGKLGELPACKGCPYLLPLRRYNEPNNYCTRPACFNAKREHFRTAEAVRIGAKLGIAVAMPDEKTVIVFDGEGYNYSKQADAQTLVKAKLPELRILPLPLKSKHAGYMLRDVLGGPAQLAATDIAVVNAWLASHRGAGAKAPAKETKPTNESDAQRAKRIEREEAAQAERRQERSAEWKSRADVAWLVASASVWLGAQLQVSGGALDFLVEQTEHNFHISTEVSEMRDHAEELTERTEQLKGKEREAVQRELIAYTVLGAAVVQYGAAPLAAWPEAQGRVERVITETFSCKLPAGWNKAPVHHTTHNCWQCGKFGSNSERITKGEEAAGWIIEFDEDLKRQVIEGVFCGPEHQQQFHADQRKGPHPMKTAAELKALLIKRGMRVPKKGKSK